MKARGASHPRQPKPVDRPGNGGRAPADAEDFRAAVRDVKPLAAPNRVEPFREPPRPIPVKRLEDEHAVLEDLSRLAHGHDVAGLDDMEIEDDALFLRPGLPRDILRKLRRTHWVIQDHLDLHGLTSEEAALATGSFLAECRRAGIRCVRIVHGKGLRSRNREPVLKHRIRKLLMRRDDVLAFVEPRAREGGGGAVVVLLEVGT
ncbi:MAG TPA: Smr/MutS family protein [Usitatibacter sp.]|nr:Smr/MutS family protein [Usitatibacter sp.]